MNRRELVQYRLSNQQLAIQKFAHAGHVVSWLGAVQAQDYLGALWAIGLRLANADEADIEDAIAKRLIIRTWPMRGTLHLVAAEDVRWMLKLMTPRILASSAHRRRQFGLTDHLLARCGEVFTKALKGGGQLSRTALYQVLEQAEISTTGGRGLQIVWHLAQNGLICFGARLGKQASFVLPDEWAPNIKNIDHDDALQKLTHRYFNGHGPATLQDFVWWSGLNVSEAKLGLDIARSKLAHSDIEDQRYWMSHNLPPLNSRKSSIHLLPAFDEYLVGYRDRDPALDRLHSMDISLDSFAVLGPTIISGGQIVGSWKREIKKGEVLITPSSYSALSAGEKRSLLSVIHRYSNFLDMPAVLRTKASA